MFGRSAQLCGRPMTRSQGAGPSRQMTWAQLCGRPMTRSQGAGPSRQMTWAQLCGRPMTRSQGDRALGSTGIRDMSAYAQAHIAATWKSAAWERSGVSSKPTLRLRRKPHNSQACLTNSVRGVSGEFQLSLGSLRKGHGPLLKPVYQKLT